MRPRGLGFLYQRFSSLLRDEAWQFRNQQSRTWSNLATIVLSGTRGLSLFLVIREGLGSPERLGARDTQRLTTQLRLALEPECLENPTTTAKEIPRDGAEWSQTLKLFVVSDVERRSTLLSSTQSIRWWQFSWPRLGAPSPAGCPWSAKLRRTPGTVRVCSKPRSPRS